MSLLDTIRTGDLLAGKYRVDRILGEGGMGYVVAAHHVHLDEKVALKFLLPAALEHPDAVARFGREARAELSDLELECLRYLAERAGITGIPGTPDRDALLAALRRLAGAEGAKILA